MPDSRPLRPLRLLRLALVFAPPFGAVFACGVSEVVDPTTEDGGATDDAALVAIPGIGARKLEQFGADVLELVRARR